MQYEAELGSHCFLGADTPERSLGLLSVVFCFWDHPSVSDLWLVYQFPVAGITDYHTLNGLKITDLLPYSSGGQESENGFTRLTSRQQDVKMSAGRHSFWSLWGPSVPCLF